MIHGMSGSTRAHLYVTQINSQKFHFYRNCRINHMFRIFEKTDLKFRVLKIESLKYIKKFEKFKMNLKFENFELRFWKLNF